MRWPLGILSRGRRDWSIEQQQWGAGSSFSSGGGPQEVSLNNNDPLGQTLAVYALTPWSLYFPQLVHVAPVARLDTNNAQSLYQVRSGNPPIAGYVSQTNRVDNTIGSPATVFKADGSMIALGDGTPLFLLQPGWQLVVYSWTPFQNVATSGFLSCGFLWSYW